MVSIIMALSPLALAFKLLTANFLGYAFLKFHVTKDWPSSPKSLTVTNLGSIFWLKLPAIVF